MIHRATAIASVVIDDVELTIHPEITYDDKDEQVRRLVARFPQFFETDNVEQATAAPGEKRAVKRG